MVPYIDTQPTGKEVRTAARAAITVLKDHGFPCCLFGSAACAIYGMQNREPNDVDIIILSTKDREEIKELLESSDSRFYLVPSANPSASHHVLWFSLPRADRACKVDILTPGTLSIPPIPISRIVYRDTFPDIPVVPFLCLLLLKLRGWTDHRVDERRHVREKVLVDEGDLGELLEMAVGMGQGKVHLGRDSEKWMPEWFVEEAKGRVGEFVKAVPGSAGAWREIGFQVDIG